jgi:hypothetical protein
MDGAGLRSPQAIYNQARIGGRVGRTFPSNLKEQVDPVMVRGYLDALQDLGNGITQSGYTAKTESTGQLNPALARWLMGFPKGWCEAAITAYRLMPMKPKRRG